MGNLNFSSDEMWNSFGSNGILGNMFKLKYNFKNSLFWQIDQIRKADKTVEDDHAATELDLQLKLQALISNTENIFTNESFSFAEMMDTILNIYGQEAKISINDATSYDNVQINIIADYIGIGALRKLFSPNYLFIEWQMHMEWKNNGKMHSDWNFYRDHWVHQMRVMYSAIELLNVDIETDYQKEKFSLSDLIIKKIKTDSTNIDKYIHSQATKEQQRINDSESLKNLFEELFKYSLNEDDLTLTEYTRTDELFQENYDENLYNYVVRYIINSAIMMAGIFHDIGYPIQHMRTHRHALQDVVINAPIFGALTSHFHDFEDDLSTSLLCRIVERDDIKKRFDASDHGVLSALTFLMFMHENGLIYQLHPAQQAAVELAALIIYDHTNTYIDMHTPGKDQDAAKKITKYHSPVNMRNPLSYIFRLCDDIQEWDRMYFRIGKNQRLVFCNKCKHPIVEDLEKNKNFIKNEPLLEKTIKDRFSDIEKKDSDELIKKIFADMDEAGNYSVFKCSCDRGSSSPRISSILDESSINHRNLNYINACDIVSLCEITHDEDELADADDENLDFLPYGYTPADRSQSEYGAFILNMNYNPWKMIELSLIEPEFGEYRSKEVNKIRRYLKSQGQFPRIIVYSVPTQNPITQKVRLLENFIKSSRRSVVDLDVQPDLIDIRESLKAITPWLANRKFNRVEFTRITKSGFELTVSYYANEAKTQTGSIPYSQSNIDVFADNILKFPYINAPNRIKDKLQFYLSLLIVARLLGKLLCKLKLTNDQIIQISDSFCVKYPDLIEAFKTNTNSESLEYLIKDFFQNELRHVDYYELASNSDNIPDRYYDLFEKTIAKKKINELIKDYTSPEYYFKSLSMETKFLDMHSDLYLFKSLSEYDTLYNKTKQITARHIKNFMETKS